jgi:hypothetical protein
MAFFFWVSQKLTATVLMMVVSPALPLISFDHNRLPLGDTQ